ncbi:MAG: ABC transporter ATP-binding protein [Candidatus Hydrogenedentes bacterium]|nr:ABC transporter ATP-binding protein [Candidatus Hydrogenedentota bacterium]
MSTPEKKKRIPLSVAWRDARELLSEHRRRLLLGLVLMLINRAAGLVLPWLSKDVFDGVIQSRLADLLLPISFAVAIATVIQAVTSFALSQIIGVAAQRAITDMRKRVEQHILRLPVRYFDATKTGVLISRIMTDAEGIRNLIGTGIIHMVGGSLTAVVCLGILFYINWHLTALILVTLLVFGGFMAATFQRLRPLFRERGQINAEVTGRLSESLGGIRIVKAYTAEKREQIVFAEGVHRLFRNIAKSMTGVSATTAFSTVIIGVIGFIMITVGGRAMMAGSMTPGDFMQYLLFTGMLAAPVVQIASISTQISEAFAGLDRIREILNTTTEDEEEVSKEVVNDVRGDVEFEGVWFEYNPGVPVLRDVSFHAPAGSTTALVGSSGSGKSTLISLVMAFNHPSKGRIVVDKRDLASTRLRDYRGHLGIVMQDNFLFDRTIADNIRFSKPHATRGEVVEVSRIAHCDEFIRQFEQEYDSLVGERGIKLSGGQRQRIAIARAILANPSILILDEATSSLDSESEAMIQDGLRALRKGRTTFVIAHRLSTIRSADQILVLEGGEIVERGTHAELLDHGGRYKQLYDKQYNFEMDQFINPGEDFTPELPETATPRR